MKRICYSFGGVLKSISWSEANEDIAKEEADNGCYTMEDDGLPETEVQLTDQQRITQLEQALDLLLSGVTE